MSGWFRLIDYLFLAYFTVEILIRIWKAPGMANVRSSFQTVLLTREKNKSSCMVMEETYWLAFDSLIVLTGLLPLLRHYVEHTELMMAFRLFWVFRVLRLFELSPALKNVDGKSFPSFQECWFLLNYRHLSYKCMPLSA